MATGNTTLLGLALPVQGELDGTWGNTVNNSITSLVDSAVAGTTTLSADADVTLTTTVLAANQARQAVILWTASNGATTRNITAPAQSKPYIVINAGTGSIVLRGAGPTTGITIVAGEKCLAAWNGSDFVKVATSTAATTTASNTFTANQIVSVTDNSNAALRITQLGTGNALVVEDDTNPDSTPFVVTAAGNVGVGTTAPGYNIQIGGGSGSQAQALIGGSTGASTLRLDLSGTGTFTAGFNNSGSTVNNLPSGVAGLWMQQAYPIIFGTNATERLRIASTGAFGLSGANYGTSGQVLTSAGSGAPPTWTTSSGGSTSIGLVRAIAINCILP
jgi:hypothetical protein